MPQHNCHPHQATSLIKFVYATMLIRISIKTLLVRFSTLGSSVEGVDFKEVSEGCFEGEVLGGRLLSPLTDGVLTGAIVCFWGWCAFPNERLLQGRSGTAPMR